MLSQIDSFSLEKIGIRDYAALTKAAHLKYLTTLEAQAEQKDPEALFALGFNLEVFYNMRIISCYSST